MNVKDTAFSRKQLLNCRGRLLDVSSPRIMGILNVTPDSFFDGGKYTDASIALERVGEMLKQGADMIDVGGYSSRPGAAIISEKEELQRLEPVLNAIRRQYPEIILSLDTFRSGVAKRMVQEYEVDIINDISGGEMDKKMFSTVAALDVPYILMHMRGTPETMQKQPVYTDVVVDILDYFSDKIYKLTQEGCLDIILDPGFGFGKTLEHNYELVQRFEHFQMAGKPLLAGISRKSMIYKPLEKQAGDVLYGTVTLHTILISKGANILRVHDVEAARECIQIATLGLRNSSIQAKNS